MSDYHQNGMKRLLLQELLKCVMCGHINPGHTVRLYIDEDIDAKRVICCSRDCQDNFYYKKRNYWKRLR